MAIPENMGKRSTMAYDAKNVPHEAWKNHLTFKVLLDHLNFKDVATPNTRYDERQGDGNGVEMHEADDAFKLADERGTNIEVETALSEDPVRTTLLSWWVTVLLQNPKMGESVRRQHGRVERSLPFDCMRTICIAKKLWRVECSLLRH